MTASLSEKDLIAAVRRGERIHTEHSLHAADKGDRCEAHGFYHRWRTIACDDDTDVCECSRCGLQRLSRCNFDEEMS